MPCLCAASTGAAIAFSNRIATLGRRRPVGASDRQVASPHELHHQKRGAAAERAVVEHRHDAGVLKARHDLRLAPEPRPRVGVGQQFGAHDFDRDVALEPHVVRAINGAHAAAAQHAIDAILRRPRRAAARPALSGAPSLLQVGSAGVVARVTRLALGQRPPTRRPRGDRRPRRRGLAVVCRRRSRATSSARLTCAGNRGQQLAIVRRVGLLRSLAAKHQRAQQCPRRRAPSNRAGRTAPRRCTQATRSRRAAAAAPASACRRGTARAVRPTTSASMRCRRVAERVGGAAHDGDRHERAGLDARHQHRHHRRLQRRSISSSTSAVSSLGSVSNGTRPASDTSTARAS